eukprot:2927127-Rhodomonas_salina.5
MLVEGEGVAGDGEGSPSAHIASAMQCRQCLAAANPDMSRRHHIFKSHRMVYPTLVVARKGYSRGGLVIDTTPVRIESSFAWLKQCAVSVQADETRLQVVWYLVEYWLQHRDISDV